MRDEAPAPHARDELPVELFDRARSLAKTVEGQAQTAESLGRLQPECVEALRASELLRAFLPSELGGHELSAAGLTALVEEIARQDGSAGWCFGMNGIVGGIAAAALAPAGVEAVFGARPAGQTFLAGGFPPQGQARREGEGWRVSGHFRFGSGIWHADFVVCTALELEGGRPVMDGSIPAMRSFVLPRDEVRVVDNWDVAGLQATGSCDYHLDGRLVDDAMSFRSSSLEAKRGRSLYTMPLLSLAGASHAGFALGVGKRALDEIAAHARWRQRMGSSSPLADRTSFQQGFARARTRLASARALLMNAYADLARATHSPAGPSLSDRADASAAVTNCYEAAIEAASFAFRAAGGAALFRDGRLQRCLRDIQAGSQHIVVSDESWERAAQVWLGIGEPQML
ncbi:MAG: acyl-CoA dehydrogenase family protein [Deltaproteobacteria bacterium]|jgi:alkylation response protein AidB-like acyl-CoA dehydrogenase|nr:acyl-CoA dehydrogenase family protein [Deltaproteobacteria bacterium]MBW2499701.1 acyl-CoA dehydrogenase family protein [Deltaproteobacteria bacterium]